MSIKVQSLVWEHSRHKGSALLVLLAIADFADDDGRAFPSVGRLADKARLTERAVYHVLHDLQDSGELSIESGGGRHRVNVYRVNLEAIQNTEQQTVKTIQRKRFTEKRGTETLKNDAETLKSTTKTLNERSPLTVIEPSIEPSGESPPTRARARDRGWEILSDFCGYEPNDPNERKARNRALKELREDLHASDDDIAEACRRYVEDMPSVARTAPALRKHFERLMRGARASPNGHHKADPLAGIREFSATMDRIEGKERPR